jgi:hypothetical protein
MLERLESMMDDLPVSVRSRLEPVVEVVQMLASIQNPGVMAGFIPSFGRGFVLRLGELASSDMVSGHATHFDWSYESDFPEMRELYERAKQNQWNASLDLDWDIDVDPRNPEVPLVPKRFIDPSIAEEVGVKLTDKEHQRLLHDATAWMLSQFLHGEQGALYAAAQVTESVQWMDGKFYGASQVMDEGRHVEAFHRYIDEKLEKHYIINDNLFTIIDSLMTDSRWDMKFLGMQIMVEGLALGAFGMLYKFTREPLLKNMLRYVIQDEARHVHYGVLALRDHIKNQLSDRERREREDWVFEIALLMQNRFMMYEIHQEWFEHKVSRRQWRSMVTRMPGLQEFRSVMFSRLVPNLREIGLLSERMMPYYEEAGLLQYMHGRDATQFKDEHDLVQSLEDEPIDESLYEIAAAE